MEFLNEWFNDSLKIHSFHYWMNQCFWINLLNEWFNDSLKIHSFPYWMNQCFWINLLNQWFNDSLKIHSFHYWMNQCFWTNLLNEWFNDSLKIHSFPYWMNQCFWINDSKTNTFLTAPAIDVHTGIERSNWNLNLTTSIWFCNCNWFSIPNPMCTCDS